MGNTKCEFPGIVRIGQAKYKKTQNQKKRAASTLLMHSKKHNKSAQQFVLQVL